MMRTTGYSLSITGQMQADGRVTLKGVHTPDEAIPFRPTSRSWAGAASGSRNSEGRAGVSSPTSSGRMSMQDFRTLWDHALTFDAFLAASTKHKGLWEGIYRIARLPAWATGGPAGRPAEAAGHRGGLVRRRVEHGPGRSPSWRTRCRGSSSGSSCGTSIPR